MARFIPDVNTRRWVVITPSRADRPEENTDKAKNVSPEEKIASCPFCPGNEDKTPPEIYRVGGNLANDKNWLVRVVPNKYQITDIHEVIIHSPDHQKDIVDFSLEQVETLIRVYKERYNALSAKGSVMIFNNKGDKSGQSLVHPHSQVVVIPRQITLDALSLEPLSNIIHENTYFITFCPEFSQWPYEIWIAPKDCCKESHKKECFFGGITNGAISSLALALQNSLQKLCRKFPGLSYNFYIYPHSCWYLRIIPRIIDRAGFELGTGLNVNIVDPSEAAKELIGN